MSKLLIVDDEAAAVEMLAELLQGLGHTVKVACKGDDALRVGASFGPDVLITDYMLDDQSGIDVAVGLRSSIPDLNVLLMTGMPAYEIEHETARVPGIEVRIKPVSVEEMIQTVSRFAKPSAKKRIESSREKTCTMDR